MYKQLFFLLIVCSLFVLSIIAINVAPFINKANSIYNDDVDLSEWANQNVKNSKMILNIKKIMVFMTV